MKKTLLAQFEKKATSKYVKKHPDFRSGDTIRVHYKIQEGSEAGKFRLQPFEGLVTRYRKGTADGSFTIRKIGAGGIGVERNFPLQSPYIEKLEVIAKGVVRRARLYYLRDLSGKAARIRSRYLGRADESGFGPEVVDAPAAETAAPESAPTN